VDDIFGAAIKLGVALLAPEALRLGHGNALQADLLQRFLDLVQLERLYDSLDLLHFALHSSPAVSQAACTARASGSRNEKRAACLTVCGDLHMHCMKSPRGRLLTN